NQVATLIANYNRAAADFNTYKQRQGLPKADETSVTAFLTAHPEHADETTIKWSRSLRTHAARGVELSYDPEKIVRSLYRPFNRQLAYFDKHLNHERGRTPSMFPTRHHENIGILLTGAASNFEFTPFISDLLPNQHLLDTAQFFPRWT